MSDARLSPAWRDHASADLPLVPPDDGGLGAPAAPGVSVYRLLALVLESWRLLLVAVLVGAGITAAVVLTAPPRYTARMALVTVSSSRTPALGGGIGAALLNLSPTGIEPTPAFVLGLMRTESVLGAVARSPLAGTGEPVVTRLAPPEAPPRPERYADYVGRHLDASVDKDAGVIHLSVTHEDSAVSRLVAERTLAETRASFQRASRAQATLQRQAQAQRVEVAQRTLRAAEARLVEFSRGNRVVEPFSAVYVQRQQLDRDVQLAQSVYAQAIADRESAAAKELEDTPALVVVDPVPDVLAPDPRFAAAKILAGALTGALLAIFVALARGLLRDGRSDDPDVHRLRAAVAGLPIVGRVARRR